MGDDVENCEAGQQMVKNFDYIYRLTPYNCDLYNQRERI